MGTGPTKEPCRPPQNLHFCSVQSKARDCIPFVPPALSGPTGRGASGTDLSSPFCLSVPAVGSLNLLGAGWRGLRGGDLSRTRIPVGLTP